MRNVSQILRLLSFLTVLAPVSALAQMPPPRVISSIDVMVLNQSNVVVGKVTRVRSVNETSADVTIEVEEVLKGAPQTTIERRQDSRSRNRLSSDEVARMAAESAHVLVVGDGFTPLGD